MGVTTAEIRYYIHPEAFDNADPAFNDIPASLEEYADERKEALTETFPGARIKVRIDFGRNFAYAVDEGIMDAVDEIARAIFERGTFWQDPQR